MKPIGRFRKAFLLSLICVALSGCISIQESVIFEPTGVASTEKRITAVYLHTSEDLSRFYPKFEKQLKRHLKLQFSKKNIETYFIKNQSLSLEPGVDSLRERAKNVSASHILIISLKEKGVGSSIYKVSLFDTETEKMEYQVGFGLIWENHALDALAEQVAIKLTAQLIPE